MGRPANVTPETEADNEILSLYNFDHLPAVFAMRDDNGQVVQEKEPCYQCTSPGFYGSHRSGTWYDEGSILVTHDTPNIHLQPLNRAAALKFAKWQDALPGQRTPISIEDMTEAAMMLAKDPRVQALGPLDAQKSVISLAEGLKIKREGKDARNIPAMGHNFVPQSGGSAAPLLGAKMSDLGQRGPGVTGPGNIPQPKVKADSFLGGPPPR